MHPSLQVKKGMPMAEAFRKDTPLRNPQYPEGADREDLRAGSELPYVDPERELPPHGETASNDRVSRSARAVGRGVGTAVAEIRQFPRRVDQARSQFRTASNQTRARASAAVLEMMDSAADRAEHLRSVAEETISDFADRVRSRSSHLTDATAETWYELRYAARTRLDWAGRRAATQWNEMQRTVRTLQREDPVRFLAVVAGVAFVVGAGLRIWRSSND
jgi:hypothetical protein